MCVAIAVIASLFVCAKAEEAGHTDGILGIMCLAAIIASMPGVLIVQVFSNHSGTTEKVSVVLLTGILWYGVTLGVFRWARGRSKPQI
jgi:hypothetical protein